MPARWRWLLHGEDVREGKVLGYADSVDGQLNLRLLRAVGQGAGVVAYMPLPALDLGYVALVEQFGVQAGAKGMLATVGLAGYRPARYRLLGRPWSPRPDLDLRAAIPSLGGAPLWGNPLWVPGWDHYGCDPLALAVRVHCLRRCGPYRVDLVLRLFTVAEIRARLGGAWDPSRPGLPFDLPLR